MTSDLLRQAEVNRLAALAGLDPKAQAALGQYFTPARAASLIASLPRLPEEGRLTVLDPGAGSGMLSAALIDRVLAERPKLSVHLVAVECDETLTPQLAATLEGCQEAGAGRVTFEVVVDDFISASTGLAADPRLVGLDLVIQNPPYAKLAKSSPARAAVRAAAVDVPNLYAAFLALAAGALKQGGQLVAIAPRSFCNGPYFGAFRSYLLAQLALDRVHVFESRATVFSESGVLQENVILSATRGGDRGLVLLSASTGHEDEASHRSVPYDEVIHPYDPHKFVRLSTNDHDTAVAERMMSLPSTVASLGLTVSTGKVVDFRSRECLQLTESDGALPLVYPGNIRDRDIEWPRAIRKPQWFSPKNEKDRNLLVPEGWYCIVKRFSSKEERRRIVAAVWSPRATPGPIAFENHLNVFHIGGAGLDEDIVYGLATWLNSSLVDVFFRTFSGHTQVNATDLRAMPFPSADALRRLATLAVGGLPSQSEIDTAVDQVLNSDSAAA